MSLGASTQPENADLLNAYPRDGSADHQLLDLFGAFEDVEGLIWTKPVMPDVAS